MYIYTLCRPYYGLADNFPCTQLLTRSVAGKKRNIYLTSALVKELLRRNELHVKVGCDKTHFKLRMHITCIHSLHLRLASSVSFLHGQFINVGVKVLARCDNYNASCPFRLCQEVSVCVLSLFVYCVHICLHNHLHSLEEETCTIEMTSEYSLDLKRSFYIVCCYMYMSCALEDFIHNI